MEKKLFHVSALISQMALYDVLRFLENKRAYNVESRPFVGDESKPKTSGWSTAQRREFVLGLLKKSPVSGVTIEKAINAAGGTMKNPYGFLSRMIKLGLVKKGKDKGMYELKGGAK